MNNTNYMMTILCCVLSFGGCIRSPEYVWTLEEPAGRDRVENLRSEAGRKVAPQQWDDFFSRLDTNKDIENTSDKAPQNTEQGATDTPKSKQTIRNDGELKPFKSVLRSDLAPPVVHSHPQIVRSTNQPNSNPVIVQRQPAIVLPQNNQIQYAPPQMFYSPTVCPPGDP